MIMALSCSSNKKEENREEVKIEVNKKPDCYAPTEDFILKVGRFEVEVILPENPVRADLLLLPGWDFSRKSWCENTSFCEQASLLGFRLILPEMGRSIYASEYFSETRKDYFSEATGTWLWDTLIPDLQKTQCLLKDDFPNFVAGISTGARGVALTCLNRSEIFSAGAALSGDYDQRLMPKDNLMRAVYGKYKKFGERWSGQDNPQTRSNELKTPLYIAHGKLDKVAPFQQSESFFDSLRTQNPDINFELNIEENAGHDYQFWNKQSKRILDYFENYIPLVD